MQWRMLFLLAVCLLLTGCPKPSEEGKTVEGLTKITLVLNWYPEAEHGGYYAALVHGYYRDAGLDVTIIPGGKGVPVIAKVDRGQATFGVTNADQVLLKRAQEADVVAVMAPLQISPRCIMVHEETGIRTFNDLQNVTLYMSPTATWAKFLQKKLPLKNVTLVPSGSMSQFLNDKQFAIQGYVFSEPFVASEKGAHPKSLMVSDLGFNPYTSVLITNRKAIQNNPELVKKMVAASIRGWKTYLKSPEKTNAHISKLNEAMGPKILAYGASAMKPLCLTTDVGEDNFGTMTLNRWQTLADQLVEFDVIKRENANAKAAFSTDYLPLPRKE
ncbi:MAG: ABC transporter substrate-binding protein [Planctomycetaceae bacterium]